MSEALHCAMCCQGQSRTRICEGKEGQFPGIFSGISYTTRTLCRTSRRSSRCSKVLGSRHFRSCRRMGDHHHCPEVFALESLKMRRIIDTYPVRRITLLWVRCRIPWQLGIGDWRVFRPIVTSCAARIEPQPSLGSRMSASIPQTIPTSVHVCVK